MSHKRIPLSEPTFQGNEWLYIKDCLDTGYVSSVGPYVERFENAIKDYVGTKAAVACINGTSALHTALLAAGVGPGDEVLVPTLTFIAPVNAVRYCGAEPIFFDCDPKSLCLNVEKVRCFLKEKTQQGEDGVCYNIITKRPIKAAIPVHIFGQSVDMLNLLKECKAHNIAVIEDAAEALGTFSHDKHVGTFGRLGCFSFNGNKIITSGGGGVIVTDDTLLASQCRHLTTQAKKNGQDYFHNTIGYNYRLSNVHAAIGLAQFEKLPTIINRKRENARLYKELLQAVPEVRLVWEGAGCKSNFWFYAIVVPMGKKETLMKNLIDQNVEVRPVWDLIHTLPMYKANFKYDIVNAYQAYQSIINLPCSPSLLPDDIEYVCGIIRNALS